VCQKESSKITTRVQTRGIHKLSITQAKQRVLAPIMKLIRESCKFCLIPPEGKNFNIFQKLKSSVLFASENSVVFFLPENPRCHKPSQEHEILPPFCIT